jgi:Bacterial SH3 domain
MRTAGHADFITVLGLTTLCIGFAAMPANAEGMEHWSADSNTAMSITGDVQFSPNQIIFSNGASLTLSPAGTLPHFHASTAPNQTVSARLFRVVTPTDAPLLRGNQLCGEGPATYIALWDQHTPGVSTPLLTMDVFTGSAVPGGEDASGFCGSYGYDVTAQPAAAPMPQQTVAPIASPLPREGQSWGGVVRAQPGTNGARVASLRAGDPVTILARTGVEWNGYQWFKIRYHGDRTGYQWGGILCPYGGPLDGTYQTCQAKQP